MARGPKGEKRPADVIGAVDAAVKSGPMQKTAVKPKERPARKGRVHKGKTRD